MIQLKSAAEMRRISREMSVLQGPQFKKVVSMIETAGNQGKSETVVTLSGVDQDALTTIEKTLSDAGYLHKVNKQCEGVHNLYVHWHSANDDPLN